MFWLLAPGAGVVIGGVGVKFAVAKKGSEQPLMLPLLSVPGSGLCGSLAAGARIGHVRVRGVVAPGN